MASDDRTCPHGVTSFTNKLMPHDRAISSRACDFVVVVVVAAARQPKWPNNCQDVF
jgi:hypothetical protein